MSFQAYIDNIEAKTGKSPREFMQIAHEKGYDMPDIKAREIIIWLKGEYGLGRGHAMALVRVIKQGVLIGDRHVGSAALIGMKRIHCV